MAVALEQIDRLPRPHMGAQLLSERRENGDIPVTAPLGDREVDLRRVEVKAQVHDLDINKLRDPCPGVKEGFDHEPIVTPFAVRGLNQPSHLVFIEPRHGATTLPRRRELQRAPHLLDDIAALIVREVMFAPQFGRLPEHLRHIL